MEPFPQLSFLSLPLKQPNDLQWSGALLNYIATSYAEDITNYEADSHVLDSLRERALKQDAQAIFAIEDLYIYYNQLMFLGSKFPLDMDLPIGWCSMFKPEDESDIISNLNYEKSCVLLRLAGLYSELGSTQNWVSTEGTRKACQYFQNAAGCLKYIKSDLLPDLRAKPPKDFEIIDALIALFMAQAHECIWRKAVMEHMKPGTIARLAVKVADFYNLFLSELNENDYIPQNWKVFVDTKSNYFTAYAQYLKANEAISSGRYGEEIARLYIAKSHNDIATAHIKSDTNLLCKSFTDDILQLEQSIERDLIRAEKDNDVVYMETVPEPSQLAPILRSDMVKPTIPNFISDPSYWLILPERPNDDLFVKRPLFEKLVPFAVHQAASVYSDRKDYLVNIEILAKIQELNESQQKFLEKLQLPYMLDVVDSLPKNLVEYAEEVQDEGGIQSLHDMLQKVQSMSRKISNMIEDGFNILEEENENNVVLGKKFGKLWNRPASRALNQNLLTLGTQYNDTITAAQKADGIVVAKVNNWGKAIAMLSKPVEEIKMHLPKLQADDSHSGVIIDLLLELRAKLESFETELENRNHLYKQVESFAEQDDISQTLLVKASELTKGSLTVKLEPEQFSDEFGRHLAAYDPFLSQLETFTASYHDLVQSVTGLHAHFSAIIANKTVLIKREKAISNLQNAFAKFKEIRINLVEGIKFYSQYTDTISKFKTDCSDFALARRTEALELTKDATPGRLLLLKK